MKVLLRRDQKTGVLGMGKVSFTLDIRAELSPEEQAHIKKYKLGDTVLYASHALLNRGSGLLGLITRLIFRAKNMSVSVDDLAKGKQIACKDIIEMLAVEEQLREACKTFKAVLTAAAHFGGEEVLDI